MKGRPIRHSALPSPPHSIIEEDWPLTVLYGNSGCNSCTESRCVASSTLQLHRIALHVLCINFKVHLGLKGNYVNIVYCLINITRKCQLKYFKTNIQYMYKTYERIILFMHDLFMFNLEYTFRLK